MKPASQALVCTLVMRLAPPQHLTAGCALWAPTDPLNRRYPPPSPPTHTLTALARHTPACAPWRCRSMRAQRSSAPSWRRCRALAQTATRSSARAEPAGLQATSSSAARAGHGGSSRYQCVKGVWKRSAQQRPSARPLPICSSVARAAAALPRAVPGRIRESLCCQITV